MWVSKGSYEFLQRTITTLESERDYWRAAFDKERERVERMQDNFLQMNGAMPVSDHGLAEVKSMAEKQSQVMESIKELFAEEVGQHTYTSEEISEAAKVGINLTAEQAA